MRGNDLHTIDRYRNNSAFDYSAIGKSNRKVRAS